VARLILVVAAIVWVVAALLGLALAAFGAGWLESILPPLSIDTDALRGAVTAVAAGLLAVGLVHVMIVIGVASRRRWGSTAGILLSAVLAATFVALGAAAGTSAVASPAQAPVLVGSAVAAAVGAGAYGVVVMQLVGERRSGSVF
jgi:hypothetical protein